MVLSDIDIRARIDRGDLVIDPYDDNLVEPSSVDLRLGEEFIIPDTRRDGITVDTRNDGSVLQYYDVSDDIELRPGEFVLASTKETIRVPDDISANVLGRSSLGRLGVSVHQTAGYIDPGFHGEVTLELSNHGPAPVRLYSGDRICQIVFHELSSPAETPYGHDGSQYQGQSGATPSGMRFE